ncbi:MAG: DUF3857 and transglutaminase domain-containing protein [Bacteroidales bacterium]|nr:DUF3857 and transglutaminase domain-containing protein [Bacteroidales bacterium]MDD4602211.1 DUF3857 and transglutaminase domain-containing protein [Bacteroidales bacterium]
MIKTTVPAFLITWLLLPAWLFAQSGTPEFGKISIDELKINCYPKDTTAPAFVVYDLGEAVFIPFDEEFNVLYTHRKRIKILTKQGISFAQMIIPLFRSGKYKDELINLEAFTYNLEDGRIKKVPLDKSTIYEQKVSDKYYIKKVAFPDVREGSIIEFNYQVQSPWLFHLQEWYFQSEIPVRLSQFILKLNPFYQYTYVLRNARKFDEYIEDKENGQNRYFDNVSYRETICTYRMRDVPAFKETDHISCSEDNFVALYFQLSSIKSERGYVYDQLDTWPKLSKDLIKDSEFGKYITSAEKFSKDIIEQQGFLNLSQAEKFESIVTWVKDHFVWNREERIYAGRSPKSVFTTKNGNSAEINLFLTGMLNAAGIEAYPVLISSQGHVKALQDYPFLFFFNYVIVNAKIDDHWILTDGTEPMCENQTIPPRCINGKGYLVKEEGSSWVDVNGDGSSLTNTQLRMKFNTALDSLEINCLIDFKGYSALRARKSYTQDKDFLESYFHNAEMEQGDSVSVMNLKNENTINPFSVYFEGKIPVNRVDNYLEIDPFCHFPIRENPYPGSIRKVPVDHIYPYTKSFSCSIVLPTGYRLKKAPEKLFRNNERINIQFGSAVQDSIVSVTGSYTLKKGIYPANDYLSLKLDFIDIIKLFAQHLIFEKETP